MYLPRYLPRMVLASERTKSTYRLSKTVAHRFAAVALPLSLPFRPQLTYLSANNSSITTSPSPHQRNEAALKIPMRSTGCQRRRRAQTRRARWHSTQAGRLQRQLCLLHEAVAHVAMRCGRSSYASPEFRRGEPDRPQDQKIQTITPRKLNPIDIVVVFRCLLDAVPTRPYGETLQAFVPVSQSQMLPGIQF